MSLSKQDQMVRRELMDMVPGTIKYIPYEFNEKYGALECCRKKEVDKRYIRVQAGFSLDLTDNFGDSLDIYYDRLANIFREDGFTFYNLACEGIDIHITGQASYTELYSPRLNDLLVVITRLYGSSTEMEVNKC